MADPNILLEYRSRSMARNNLILQYNYFLETKKHFYSLNEKDLEELIFRLDHLVLVKDGSYWLTLTRINELVLLCAEHYANNNELTLAEDLLLNPRLVLVHVHGTSRPIVKKRHLSLREQFKGVAETSQAVKEWLQKETVVELKSEALQPSLFRKLEHSGYVHPDYLQSVNQRKLKIIELINFLSHLGLQDSLDLYYWLQKTDSEDRELFKTKKCPCNLDLFMEIGRQVMALAKGTANSLGCQQNKSNTSPKKTEAVQEDPSFLRS